MLRETIEKALYLKDKKIKSKVINKTYRNTKLTDKKKRTVNILKQELE